jgi:hypothetical protein
MLIVIISTLIVIISTLIVVISILIKAVSMLRVIISTLITTVSLHKIVTRPLIMTARSRKQRARAVKLFDNVQNSLYYQRYMNKKDIKTVSTGKKKWKDALLKTSLPLEYLVAEKLGKHGFHIDGEYSFVRRNEQNIETEFSVDLQASELLKKGKGDYWADLNFLIECKYNYPGVRWVFSPHPENSEIGIGVVNILEQLCTRRIADKKLIYEFEEDLPYCVKGIELHETDANTQSIDRGIYQLKYAVLELASNMIYFQVDEWNDEDLHLGVICPILVTTASLHVFRDGLTLEQFQNASDLNEVAEEVDALVAYQENKPQLNADVRKLLREMHARLPAIKKRLEQLEEIEGKPEYRGVLPVNFLFDSIFSSYPQRVLIVTYKAFEDIILKIRDSVSKSSKNLKRIAVLKKDMTKRISWVEAPPKAKQKK